MAKVSCRKAFTSELQKLAQEDPNILSVCTDSRGSVTMGGFAAALPDQFLEFGIAEQNAVAAAAGAALCGKNVFVSGPACFLAARSFEQVKVDVAYNQTNVKIVGVSSGVSYGPLGGTHTSLHDFASMRALPNIMVLTPADAVECRMLTRALAARTGPAYLRMGRGDVEEIYEENETFEFGKAKTVCAGNDVSLIACGEAVWPALNAAGLLRQRGIEARVIDLYCLKPADEETVIRAARETGHIVTVEEHSIFGGLGELVAHITAEHCPVRMRMIGFPDSEVKVGEPADLFRYYGLTAENIAAEAENLLRE